MPQLAVLQNTAPQLIRYEAACKALAEARAVDEVQDVRSQADAIRVYAMQAKNKALEVDAAEIRIRAERRLGELLTQQKAAEGLNPGVRVAGKEKGGASVVVSDDRRQIPTLADAGISKDLSSRAQKLAAVPADEFEAEVGEWRERVAAENARVTTRLAKAGDRAQAAANADTDHPEIIRLRDELAEARDNARELAALLESYDSVTAGEHAAAKEMAKLRAQLRTVEATRDQWMTTANELRREVKSLQRKLGARQ